MKNGYNIGFDDELGYIGVYLVPQCDHEAHLKKIGYIENNVFKCTDSDMMTLEVMEGIVNHWKVYRSDLEKIKS